MQFGTTLSFFFRIYFFFWAASQVWADNLTGEKGDWGPFQRTFLVLFFGFLFLLLPLVISCWQMSWLLMAAVTSFLELARMESENNFYHCLFPFVSRLHFVLFVVLFLLSFLAPERRVVCLPFPRTANFAINSLPHFDGGFPRCLFRCRDKMHLNKLFPEPQNVASFY